MKWFFLNSSTICDISIKPKKYSTSSSRFNEPFNLLECVQPRIICWEPLNSSQDEKREGAEEGESAERGYFSRMISPWKLCNYSDNLVGFLFFSYLWMVLRITLCLLHRFVLSIMPYFAFCHLVFQILINNDHPLILVVQEANEAKQ